MHPRGIYELRDLGKVDTRNEDVEYFAIAMQSLHEQVKRQLQGSNAKHKHATHLKIKEAHFEVEI